MTEHSDQGSTRYLRMRADSARTSLRPLPNSVLGRSSQSWVRPACLRSGSSSTFSSTSTRSVLPFALALVAGAGAYLHHDRGSADWSVDYKTVILVTCGLTGVIGAWMLIEEVRSGILDDNAAEVIGAVLYWATSITSGVGAWQLSKRREPAS